MVTPKPSFLRPPKHLKNVLKPMKNNVFDPPTLIRKSIKNQRNGFKTNENQ